MESLTKNIILCSDGTGNSTIKGRGTNVFKLFEAVDVNGHRSNPRLRRQLAFYDDGVGTEELKWIRAFAGATGYGLSRNVKQLYRELCRVYEPGDWIYLFGFSRGAFTVRTLSGLIDDCGLIDPADCPTEAAFRERVRCAYKAYRRKYRAWLTRLVVGRRGMTSKEFREQFARRDVSGRPLRPRVRLLGVWDTVDAVGLPFALADVWNKVVWQYKFETTSLCGTVERGCHALALDDSRAEFAPVLWNEDDPSTRVRAEQVWFSGAHANVGGGYPQHGMSLVTLDWMMRQAETQGLRFVEHVRDEYRTAHSFADKLYDPRSGLGMFYRWKPRDVADLCARRGIRTPKLHLSAVERIVQAPWGYAPGTIPPRCDVVATEDEPSVRLPDLAEAIGQAYDSVGGTSLVSQMRKWVYIGRVAYGTFIGGLLITLGLAAGFGLRHPAPWVVLGVALTVGYLLTASTARRLQRRFSGFWHDHRPALRGALRRTPPPVQAPDVQAPDRRVALGELEVAG